jgi:hypothetical protein
MQRHEIAAEFKDIPLLAENVCQASISNREYHFRFSVIYKENGKTSFSYHLVEDMLNYFRALEEG